jgi:hypothetical protein
MKKLIFLAVVSGTFLISAVSYGQYKYTYKPATTSPAINKKTYQYKPAAAQSKPVAATAQPPAPNGSVSQHTVAHAPAAVAASGWASFKNSALYRQRQIKYQRSFQNTTHTFNMDDGSKLTITFQKSPEYAGTPNSINTHTSPAAPVHGQSNQSDPDWACSTQNVQVTAQTTDFNVANYSLQMPHIYPGAIYTYGSYISGAFQTPSAPRNPITIFTDNYNVSGDNSVVISNPNQASIQNAVAQLYNRLPANISANGSTTYSYYESYNTAGLALKLSAGGSGYGFKFSDNFGENQSSHSQYITIDVKKELYAISTLPPQNGYYADASTESTPDLMVIGNVTYGVRILANLTITFSSDSLADTFNASYSGAWSAQAAMNFLQSHSDCITNINAYEIGGPNVGSVQIDKDHLLSSINNILSQANYRNAQPISYQFYDMAGDVIGSYSATDQFPEQSCVPSGANTPVLTSATVSINCGGDCKDDDTHYEFDLYNSSGTLVASYRNNSNNTKWPDNSANQSGDNLHVYPGHKLSEFQSNGAKFKLTIYPNGHDEVDMTMIKLNLTFNAPGGSSPQNVSGTWNGVDLSQDNTSANLLFYYANNALKTN